MNKIVSTALYFMLLALCTSHANGTLRADPNFSTHATVSPLATTAIPPIPHVEEEEAEIPLTEDLMREHGVLNRVLLIYEEIIKRISANKPFAVSTLDQAVYIIKTFIEEYHEKMEEDYLFPLFEKQHKEVRLVRTLKLQHTRGKEITGKIRSIIAASKATLLSVRNAQSNNCCNNLSLCIARMKHVKIPFCSRSCVHS